MCEFNSDFTCKLNIAESTSLQNVNLAEFMFAFLEEPLKYAKITHPTVAFPTP